MGALEDEFVALADQRTIEWQLLRDANALRHDAPVLSDRYAQSTVLYKAWMAKCEANDREKAWLRRTYFPKAGHLFVNEHEALTASPKIRRTARVWSR